MDVTVKTLDGKNRKFTVPDDRTVRQFKDVIANSIDIPSAEQRLIYQGKVLQDDKLLSSYGVDGHVIHVVQRLPPSTRPPAASTSAANANAPATTTAGGATGTAGATGSAEQSYVVGSFTLPTDVMDTNQVQNIVENVVQGMGDVGRNARVSTRSSADGSSVDVHINLGQIAVPSVQSQSARLLHQLRHMINMATRTLDRLENPPRRSRSPASASQERVSGGSDDAEPRSGSAAGSDDTEPRSETPSPPSEPSEMEEIEMETDPDSTEAAAPSSTTDRERGSSVDAPANRGSRSRDASSSSTGSRQSPGTSPRTQRGPRHPPVTRLGELMEDMFAIQRRFQPHLERFQRMMADDPAVSENRQENRNNQRLFNLVTETLHHISHSYHLVSELMVDMTRPAPRVLRAPPMIQTSGPTAIMQHAIPVQAQVQVQTAPVAIAVSQPASVPSAATTTSTTTASSASDTASSTTAASAATNGVLGAAQQQVAAALGELGMGGMNAVASSNPYVFMEVGPHAFTINSISAHVVSTDGGTTPSAPTAGIQSTPPRPTAPPPPMPGSAAPGGPPRVGIRMGGPGGIQIPGMPGGPGMAGMPPGGVLRLHIPGGGGIQLGGGAGGIQLGGPGGIQIPGMPGGAGIPGMGGIRPGQAFPIQLGTGPAPAGGAPGAGQALPGGLGGMLPPDFIQNIIQAAAQQAASEMAAQPGGEAAPATSSTSTSSSTNAATTSTTGSDAGSAPVPPQGAAFVLPGGLAGLPGGLAALQGQLAGLPGGLAGLQGLQAGMPGGIAGMPPGLGALMGLRNNNRGLGRPVDPFLPCQSRHFANRRVQQAAREAQTQAQQLLQQQTGGAPGAATTQPSAVPGAQANPDQALAGMVGNIVTSLLGQQGGAATLSGASTSTTSANSGPRPANPFASLFSSQATPGAPAASTTTSTGMQGGIQLNGANMANFADLMRNVLSGARGQSPSSSATPAPTSTSTPAPTTATPAPARPTVTASSSSTTSSSSSSSRQTSSSTSSAGATGSSSTAAGSSAMAGSSSGQEITDEMFTQLVSGICDYAAQAVTGQQPRDTMADFLSNLSSTYNIPQGEGLVTDIFNVVARTLTFPDFMNVFYGQSAPLQNLREPLQELVREKIMEGQDASDENVRSAVQRLMNDLQGEIETTCQGQTGHDDINLVQTYRQFLTHHFTECVQLVLNSPDGDSEFGTHLHSNVRTLIHELVALSCHILDGRDAALHSMLECRVRGITGGVNPVIQQWMIGISRQELQRILPQVSVQPYRLERHVVRGATPNTCSPAVCPSDMEVESSGSTMTSSSPEAMSVTSQTSSTSQTRSPDNQAMEVNSGCCHNATSSSTHERREPVPGAPDLPANFISRLPPPPMSHPNDSTPDPSADDTWQQVVPREWVPVIIRDVNRQRRQPPQQPLSDAYINGMPAKRRKIMEAKRDHDDEMTQSSSIPEAIRIAARAAGVEPITSHEAIAQDVASSSTLHAAFDQEVATVVTERIGEDSDYMPQKYPTTEKYTKRKK